MNAAQDRATTNQLDTDGAIALKKFCHPERSRPTGDVAEGPCLIVGATEQVPPLRLAALGSGRDDGNFWP